MSVCLEAEVRGKQVQLGIFALTKDKVFCQGKKTVMQWGLLPMGIKFKPWVISSNILSASGYVRIHLMNKERFHLWDFPADLWMKINKEQLGSMWR